MGLPSTFRSICQLREVGKGIDRTIAGRINVRLNYLGLNVENGKY